MSRFNKSLVCAVAVVGASVAGLNSAQALSVLNPTITGAVPDETWSYSVSIASGESVTNTTGAFTVYDFLGYIPGSATAPANWTFSGATLTGPTYPLVSPTDNAAVFNLTWTYSGASPLVGAVTVNGFTAQTVDGFVNGSGSFAGKSIVGARTQGSVGHVNVPQPTPEPGTLSLMGVGLMGVIGGAIRRRKSSRSK